MNWKQLWLLLNPVRESYFNTTYFYLLSFAMYYFYIVRTFSIYSTVVPAVFHFKIENVF